MNYLPIQNRKGLAQINQEFSSVPQRSAYLKFTLPAKDRNFGCKICVLFFLSLSIPY